MHVVPGFFHRYAMASSRTMRAPRAGKAEWQTLQTLPVEEVKLTEAIYPA